MTGSRSSKQTLKYGLGAMVRDAELAFESAWLVVEEGEGDVEKEEKEKEEKQEGNVSS